MILTKDEDTVKIDNTFNLLEIFDLDYLNKEYNYENLKNSLTSEEVFNLIMFMQIAGSLDTTGAFKHRLDKKVEGKCTCAQLGRTTELLFEMCMKINDLKLKPATLEQQYDHIDYVIEEKYNIEVKGPKRFDKKDETVLPNIIWVEFENGTTFIENAKSGWLYGKEDYVAFYQPLNNSFYFVEREKLEKYCEKICSKKYVTNKWEAIKPREQEYYLRYRRPKLEIDETALLYFDELDKIGFQVYSLGRFFWKEYMNG